MRIVAALAGFTAIEAERFRKTLGTGTREAVSAYRGRFLSGCARRGVTEADARGAWELLEPSSHIILKACMVADALVAYRTAYLAAHVVETNGPELQDRRRSHHFTLPASAHGV